MAELIPMLALSPTMEVATIVKWNKAEGDTVASGDALCEVETDKAIMDYEATVEGKLLKILVGDGQQCGVGEPIAIIGGDGEDISGLLAKAQQKPPAAGAKPAPSAAAAAAPTSAQAPMAAPGPQGPAPQARAGQPPAQPAPPAQAQPQAAPAAPPSGRAPVSPVARRLAEQAGVDVSQIRGSGPGGRVVKRDVEEAAARGAAPSGAVVPAPTPAAAAPVAPGAKPPAAQAPAAGPVAAGGAAAELTEQVIPVSPMRRAIAERMTQSKAAAPHFYLTISVQMDELMEARKRLNESLGARVSLNAFLIKFVAEAMTRVPRVNASWEGHVIRLHGRADIALAVALTDGLIAPVIRDCSRKGLLAIDGELGGLVARAQAGQLRGEEIEAAGFTISNLGSMGIDHFTAVINPPGSATLAVGRIAKTPVIDADGELSVHSIMMLTLSCDHRVIDGAVGAKFLAELKRLLENPVQPTLVVQV